MCHLTETVSEIQRDIGWKSSIFSYPLITMPPLGGSRRNSATPFGMEKLEWFGYPMVKQFRRYLSSFWRNSRTWRTDRRTPGDGNSRAMHSIARQKWVFRAAGSTRCPDKGEIWHGGAPPCQISALSGQKCGNKYSPQTVKISNFGHIFAPQCTRLHNFYKILSVCTRLYR